MKVEKGQVRAPEIGRPWLNSPPLSLRQLRGRIVLIDFWDYTCVNCLRTLPYVQAWHQRYQDQGLTVIGVHTPEFTFAQYEQNVERAVRDLGITYPVVTDSNYELWKAFANRYWPTKYLLDGESYLRYAHFGEGAYGDTEQAIQELLREISPGVVLPAIMDPVRDTDRPGAVCFQPSPELYLGHRRGRIGNESGFREDEVADYSFDGKPEEGQFYVQGRWASTAEYLESAAAGDNRIVLKYSASAVNLVLASPRAPSYELVMRQDGKPFTRSQATPDVRFRPGAAGGEESFILVEQPRMYQLVDNRAFGTHTLELLCPQPGLAAFAFTFTSCL
ncbi:MAG TPA: redoxin domain-containing protein, partial [Terriglobales bacterium]|nr:redoxin domain-containing protein [Terriglobales bacterium]